MNYRTSFLPEDYIAPAMGGGYMKIQDGENRVRILSDAIFGWEDWIDKKPMRFRMDKMPEKPHDPEKPIKHFWAFIVWDCLSKSIKILEITQGSIRNRIQELSKDDEWGQPFGYDIKIIRKGEGLKTEYAVNPCVHKEITPEIKEAFMARPIDLEALFAGADPFQCHPTFRTKGFFEEGQISKDGLLTVDQLEKLGEYIGEDMEITNRLLKYFKVEKFSQLPATKYKDLIEIAKTYKAGK